MSWLFSRALVEEYSAGTSLAGEPLSQLNVMPTPHKFWRADKTIEPSAHSRFGLTSQLLTAAHGQELLMSFRAAFRARTSAEQARAPELMAPGADFGPKCAASFAKYDRAESMWKTAQCSLFEDSGEFLETWPRWGSMRNGVSYLRQIPELPICVNASGLWPTPTVHGNHNQPGASKTAGWGLSSAVNLWPTPVADDTGSRSKKYAQGGTPLSLAAKSWPTPTAMNFTGGAALCKWGGAGARKKMATMVTPEEMNGPLNPVWVEWLMGWPAGWTDLKPLAMDRFREWQRQHGECLEAAE